MPAGTPKVALFGGKSIVPGGTQTFNSPGTFTVPVGVTKINVTGKGGSGNPGNSSNAGNAGSGGVGGTGGYGYTVKPYCPCNGQGGTQTSPTAPGLGGYLQCGIPQAGLNGNPGSAGNPGNAGNASTGFCLTFPGGAAGNGAAAGSGGSKGTTGSAGGTLYAYYACPCPGSWQSYSTQPGGAGGNGGGAGTTAGPCYSPSWFLGFGGGGAGVCNNGSTKNCPYPNSAPLNTGGAGGTPGGGAGGGYPACGQGPCFTPWMRGRKANANRAGSGGGAGSPFGFYGPGGGGGGRGNLGNPGTSGNAGSAANPSTTNCRAVTPGASYPISVGSPGGQVVISWNPQ